MFVIVSFTILLQDVPSHHHELRSNAAIIKLVTDTTNDQSGFFISFSSSEHGKSFTFIFQESYSRISIVTGWLADLEFQETGKRQRILWHLKKIREKSGNFMKFEKNQGILTRNWEKSGNFTCVK